MNRKQREKNRETARHNHIAPRCDECPECGIRERHSVGVPRSLEAIMLGTEPEGFWTCPKFYGADGRRIAP